MDANDVKVIEYITDKIKPNDLLVDVGANEGDYTDFFKNKLKGTGRIFCIELLPETYNHLVNKFTNDTNVIILNKAVCDKNEPITYYRGVNTQTNNIIGHDMNFKSNEKIGVIDGLRLDTLLNDVPIIDLVKIDVEGAELSVLNGMSGIIYKTNNILVECHLDEDWFEIKDLLLNKYKLSCYNILDNTEITNDSKRAYQCFCKKK